MKVKLFVPLMLLLFFTSGCAYTIVNKSFSIHTGNSIQTRPKNDSCFTKHIDIVHFTEDSMQLYYRKVYICRTMNGKTKTEETRLAETLSYRLKGNMVLAPAAVYDTLELRGRRLKTKYGAFLKRARNLKEVP
jgi:hypothetical protein